MEKTNIYGLYSTRDEKKIRYIGKSNNLKLRLKGHIWTSINYESNTYKSCWIRKEINDGYEIKYKILETCNLDEWVSKEIEYISKYENLTNHHKGGLGGSPLKYSKTYSELKEWVNNELPKEITSHKKWREYIKLNYAGIIPMNPNKVYKNYGWTNWADFLNTSFYHDINYVSYEEFKAWVIKNANSCQEFKEIKKPYGIPSHPERIYNDVWIGWIDIFSNAMVTNRSLYWDYETCKKYLNDNYGDMTLDRFKKLCKNNELPYHIPKKPERVFVDFNYKEFLNLNYVPYLDYEKAKEIVHTFKIKTNREWRGFIKENKLPLDIPRTPERVYKNEWISWPEWLGSDNVANKLKGFYTYDELKKIINELNIKSFLEFKRYMTNDKPNNKSNIKIPTNPSEFYKNRGWVSWYDLFN